MPPIYTSFLFDEGDNLEIKQSKLYLAIISLGEDLYTFNANLNEMRKKHEDIDKKYAEIKSAFEQLRAEVRNS